MIKNLYKAVLFGVAVVASVTITSCSSEDEPFDTMPQGEVSSRSGERDAAYVITFEDGTRTLAGPTSYGANLYNGTYSSYIYRFIGNDRFTCGINTKNGTTVFSNGGIVLSQWNMMSNPADMDAVTHAPDIERLPTDWWYSYYNQCSVYNAKSVDGSNEKAGASNSNTFAVVYGYRDAYNSQWMDKPYFTFTSPKSISSLYLCNTAYTYGVIKNGNAWYDEKGQVSGHAQSLVDQKGWFKITATGYDKNGNALKTSEFYICDYRPGSETYKEISSTWEEWSLSMSNVYKVEFNFEGSDNGDYGLNTPAYICIDNITVF